MHVVIPPVTKIVEDYDISFSNGAMVSITVDTVAGDTFVLGDRFLKIRLESKPLKTNPKVMVPARDITISLEHVMVLEHQEREVVELTPEQLMGLSKQP